MIKVVHSPALYKHLSEWTLDGASVASVLFDGNRLSYPERRTLETELGYVEPYTLEHESRTIVGFSRRTMAAIRLLSRDATELLSSVDQTLELLWRAHDAWIRTEVSLDRLIAALVMVQSILDREDDPDRCLTPQHMEQTDAAFALIEGMYTMGFPPTRAALEEIFDGAPPACVGLGLVEV
jgi:hypothetical protein